MGGEQGGWCPAHFLLEQFQKYDILLAHQNRKVVDD